MAFMTSIIEAEEALRRHAEGAQFVDGTWRLADGAVSAQATFARSHIPGAVFFDIDDVSDRESDLPHMLPTPEAFAEAAGDMGLSEQRPIVVYDQDGVFSAARVWWTLKTMGAANVAVLNGGLPAWLDANGAMSTEQNSASSEKFGAQFASERLSSLDRTLQAVKTGDALILDARPADRFRGAAPEPRPGLASGAMPGAVSLPVSVIAPNGRLPSPADTRRALEAVGWRADRPTITTCGSGVAASLLALAIEHAGGPPAAVYDGSWAEWGRGRAPDGWTLPIVRDKA